MKHALNLNKKTVIIVVAFFVFAALVIGIRALFDTNAFDSIFQEVEQYESNSYGGDILQPIEPGIAEPIEPGIAEPIEPGIAEPTN